MRLRDLGDPVAALLSLLEDERAALREGRLRALPDIASRKERLVAAVTRSRPGPERAQRLRAAAERNAGLLAACAEGIRAARRLVDAAVAEPAPMQTYSADGRTSQLPAPTGPRGTTA
jgi:flagellar biosynthesis/type III secretory pathway chaperone